VAPRRRRRHGPNGPNGSARRARGIRRRPCGADLFSFELTPVQDRLG
jgi:hypothetical protein